MKEETDILKENETFESTQLTVIAGRWVYDIKRDHPTKKNIGKSMLVVKGCSHKSYVGSHETFSATANLISIRVLM